MKKAKGKQVTVAVSGGFDPLHLGHVRYLSVARSLGDRLVVILNNDNWLIKKKGYTFMSEKDRKEILASLASVDEVVLTSHAKNDSDRSVCSALRKLRPDIFANGGDRTSTDARNPSSSLNAEYELCRELGIKMVFNVGKGGKLRSSSALVARFKKGEARAILHR